MTIINAFNSNFIAVEVIYVQSLSGGDLILTYFVN